MYKPKIKLRKKGIVAITCGWDSTTLDDQVENNIQNAKYSDNLHCMSVILHGAGKCNLAIGRSDFSKKQLCGEALHEGERTVWVITFKSFWLINIIW